MTIMHIELRVGEAMYIDGVRVVLAEKSGSRARLQVHADRGIQITHPGRKPATPSAQECASSAGKAKEHTHGQYPL